MARGILQIRVLLERERGGIDAETQAGRGRSVFEDVTQVAVATRAENFGAFHPVTVVGVGDDIFLGDRLEKAGPAGAGIEFGFGRKQRQPATNAIINARLVIVVKIAAEGALGSLVASDGVLLRGQLLAPFGVRFNNLGRFSDGARLAFVVEESNFNHNHLIRIWGLRGRRSRGLGERVRAASQRPADHRAAKNGIERSHKGHSTASVTVFKLDGQGSAHPTVRVYYPPMLAELNRIG
jgi:hypothetical protein